MKPLRIHYFQHEPFEGLGCIEQWAIKSGHILSSTKFYENHLLPEISSFDWLIIMGGGMNVYEEDKYPWLRTEKEFIRHSIGSNKIILGICLGSQLIAAALGSKVYPNIEKEIGWFNIYMTDPGKAENLLAGFGSFLKVFHWHGDTFDLPRGAIHLFQSEGCINQAFILNGKVFALQFHLETTLSDLKIMIENGKNELSKDRFIQTEAEIMSNTNLIAGMNKKLWQILDRIEKNF